MIKIDLTGKRYGLLTVLKLESDIPGKKKKWLCRCDCEEVVVVTGGNLQSGHSTKCKKCQLREKHDKQIKHNASRTKLYNVWRGMLSRCENPSEKSYLDYGARGISVCSEWHNAEIFIKWAYDNGYRDGLEIDRKDVDGDYSPNNCRWVSRIVNANNKRNNKWITYDGETKTLAEWARHYGVNYKNLSRNILKGYTLEEAVKREKAGDKTHMGSKNWKEKRGE